VINKGQFIKEFDTQWTLVKTIFFSRRVPLYVGKKTRIDQKIPYMAGFGWALLDVLKIHRWWHCEGSTPSRPTQVYKPDLTVHFIVCCFFILTYFFLIVITGIDGRNAIYKLCKLEKPNIHLKY